MTQTLVVTGASGYLGHHVVREAIARGHRVMAITRHSDNELRAVIPSDLLMEQSVFDLAEPDWELVAEADSLIHLAWRDVFDLRSRAHGEDLSSHYRFLLSAAERGVRRIAPVGSMHEIGYWHGAVNAETPSHPTTPYGIAKRALRELLEVSLADTDTEVGWLRCYYVTGDDARSNSVFSKILTAAARGDATFPFSTGQNAYDFLPVDILARQIVAAATAVGETGVIECASGRPTPLATAAEQFIRDQGLSIRLDYGAFPHRPFDSPAIWGDATRINRIVSGGTLVRGDE